MKIYLKVNKERRRKQVIHKIFRNLWCGFSFRLLLILKSWINISSPSLFIILQENILGKITFELIFTQTKSKYKFTNIKAAHFSCFNFSRSFCESTKSSETIAVLFPLERKAIIFHFLSFWILCSSDWKNGWFKIIGKFISSHFVCHSLARILNRY